MVGVLKNGPGPVVLVRTDMDALPVIEETGLPYASTVEGADKAGREVGVMHACGHDIHMTCFVGTARWLADHRDRWSGTVVLVGQPAEEVVGGARAMLEDGLYTRFPRPDFALALHCTADEPTGTVRYCPGPMLASSTSVIDHDPRQGGTRRLAAPHGRPDRPGGAGGRRPPDDRQPRDRAGRAGRRDRRLDPRRDQAQHHPRRGQAPAHAPDLQRAGPPAADRRQSSAAVEGLAQAHQAPEPTVEVEEATPPTINTPELVERVVPAFVEALGSTNVKKATPVMGAEDFGLFGEGNVPICMFWLGTINPARIEAAPRKGESHARALHSSKYYPDPGPSIETGIRAMTAAVIKLLPPKH